MSNDTLSRRELLKGAFVGIAAGTAVTFVTDAAHAAAPLVDEADPQAKSLGYVHDTTKVDAKANPTHKPTQKCNNCIQYQGKATDATGGCNLFPGKLVNGNGWCKVWVVKPGASA